MQPITIQQKGFIPVMLTPFQPDGTIDFPALDQLTERYLETGASGLFANCLSSEMFELTSEERLQVIGRVLRVVDGAVPVVATGTFGGSLETQAAFVKQVYDTGVDAVIAITSLLADETEPDERLNERVFDLLDLTPGIPMGFYECPVPYKRLLTPVQLGAYVATGRVIYHKDTSLDILQVREKLQAGQGHLFGLYDAYMVHAVESLRAGSAGLSCIQGNFFPELIVWLCQNYQDAPADEVQQVQQFLANNMEVMHHVYPVAAKYCLGKRGLNISTFTRRKVGGFSASVKKGVDDLCMEYDRLRSKLGIIMNYEL